MRTFNVRLAAILLAVLVVFGGGVYLLHAYQVRRNAKAFIGQADQAEKRAAAAAKEKDGWQEQKARREAINFLSWYVRLMPDQVESRERLGLMMADQSHMTTPEQMQDMTLPKDARMFRMGRDHLETVLRQDPERKAARQQLVKMAMLAHRFQDAKDHLQILLKASPNDPELLELLGQCQAATGNTAAAVDTLKKAVQYGPGQLTAYETLARLLRSLELPQPKEADRWMEKLVAANPKSAKAHYLRGRYLIAIGQGKDALEEAKVALKLSPDDADVLLLAAGCYLMHGQPEEARKLVDHGVAVHPANADMYKTKADVEIRSGHPDQAVAVLRKGLRATERKANTPKNPDATEQNLDLLWSTANVMIEVNRLKEAQELIDQLEKTNLPKEHIGYLRARIEFVEGHWLAARDGFEKVRSALIVYPQLIRQIDLWIGQCYGQLGNRSQQLQAYRKALIDPSYSPARGALIDTLQAMGRIDEALQEFDQLRTHGGLAPGAAVQWARLLLLRNLRQEPARRDWAAVEKTLDDTENAAKAAPDTPDTALLRTQILQDIALLRAQVLQARERTEDAEKLLREARATYPKQPAFVQLLMAMAQQRADWPETEKLLKDLDDLLRDNPVQQRLAQARYFVRRYGKAASERLQKQADDVEKLVDAQRLQLRRDLLQVALLAGDAEQADYFCGKLAEADPNGRMPAALLPLARLVLKNLRQQEPAKRDWKTVEKALDEAQKAQPDSLDVPLLRAVALRAQGRGADAEKLLREARVKHPKQPAFLLALIDLSERRAAWPETEKLVKELEDLLGDSPPQQRLALLLGLIDLTQRRADKQQSDKLLSELKNLQPLAAQYLVKLAQDAEKFFDAERLQLWAGLLDDAMQVGDTKLADDLCRILADKQPNNVQVRYMQFDRALAGGKQADIEKALAEIERVAGQDAHWLYGKATLLLMHTDSEKDPLKRKESFEQALDYLTKAREQQGDWSRVPMVAAGVYLALGKPEQATESYRDAVGLGERNPVAMLGLLQRLLQSGKPAEADKWFRQFQQEQGEGLSPDLRRAGAQVALAVGDTDRAAEMARKAVTPESKDYREQLWLAQVLGAAGSQTKAAAQDEAAQDKAEQDKKALLADAEKAARRAVEIEPKLPLTWVALVRLLAALGEKDKAEKAIQDFQDAVRKEPIAEKDALLALAQCYEATREMDQAEEKYKAALAADPQNPALVRTVIEFFVRTGKIELAEAQLQRILDGKLPAKKEELAWARGQQAMILFARGGHQNHQKARELIQKNFSEGNPSLLDRRLDYAIDASDPDSTRRGEARRKMEEMLKNQTATPEDRFALAQMYLGAGDWIKASAEFRGLVTSSDKEPRYLMAYITPLLQHGETSSAENYLDRLEALVPKQFLTVSLGADLLMAKKEPQKALAVLNEFIDRTDVQPKDRGTRSRMVAEKLLQLGPQLTGAAQKPLAEEFARRAETLYRAWSKENPGRELLLAAFLGALGKTDEALDLLEQKLEQSTPQDFARACSLIWQGGSTFSAEQVRRLDGIVRKALVKFDRPVMLLMVLAELRTRQTRYADAEAFYREVIKKNSGDPVAMNNLAVLLALQGVKLDEALRLMNQAVEIAGRVAAMLDSRCSVYMALNDQENALKDVLDALKDGETPVRLFHLAQVYRLSGQEKEAKETMGKALQKGLTREMLQPLELPAFEKLRKLPR